MIKFLCVGLMGWVAMVFCAPGLARAETATHPPPVGARSLLELPNQDIDVPDAGFPDVPDGLGLDWFIGEWRTNGPHNVNISETVVLIPEYIYWPGLRGNS